MRRPILRTALLCLFPALIQPLWGQTAHLCRDVVASAGGNTIIAGKNIEYTLGESVIGTIGNGDHSFTQGFHQPEICALTVGVSEIATASGLKVYPNPTNEALFLQFDAPVGQAFHWQVWSADGQLLEALPDADDRSTLKLDCRAYPSGTYWLIAQTKEGKRFFQTSFVKTAP